MSASEYLVWDFEVPEHTCTLGVLENVDDPLDLQYNVSRADGFPDDASLAMDPDEPHDTLLADRLQTISDLVVISKRTVDLLRASEVSHIEFLPVRVLDHKKRPIAEKYFIANPLEPVECLDDDASEAEDDVLVEGKIEEVEQLVLVDEKVDTSRQIFCCDRYHDPVLIRRDLAKKMDKAGLTGNLWVELSDFES